MSEKILEDLDKKYDQIRENRILFGKNIFSDLTYDFLRKWKAFNGHALTTEFVNYICEKEQFLDQETFVETKKKERKKYIKQHPMRKQLQDLCIHSDFTMYRSIENLSYNEWQTIKPLLTLIQKHIKEYIIYKQKKTICTLTDCYKDKTLKRKCELCGNEVELDNIYCSQCGNKIRGEN